VRNDPTGRDVGIGFSFRSTFSFVFQFVEDVRFRLVHISR